MAAEDAQEARACRGLEAWAAFPAHRDPRPLVLLDTIPAIRVSGIFPDAQTKLAFQRGAVEAVPGFPVPVLEALRGQPEDNADAGPPLLLTRAVLDSSPYETDRGPRTLPTWNVHAQNVFHAIQVLDPAVISSGQVWEPPGRERISGQRPTATLGADGRTLTMSYTGGGHFADSNQPTARTLELGNAALMFAVRRKPRRNRSGWYADVGLTRDVTAVLPSPLGNRVLLDIKGGPVLVTPGHRT